MDEKEARLRELLKEVGKIVVPYSGGIDSSYLLKIAVDTLGRDNVIAAVVNSELFSDREFSEAIDLGTEMGARVLGLEMEELSDPHIASNTPNSWYYSKAKRAGVTNWNKTPSCSLASRFPYGTRITPEKVEAVFKAEEYFAKRGFEPVRVRVHQDLARIEVGADQIEKLVKNHEEINQMMQELGFLFVTVDLQGYKYGRMNDQLDEKTKKEAIG